MANTAEIVNRSLNITPEEFARLQALRLTAMANRAQRDGVMQVVGGQDAVPVAEELTDTEFLIDILDRAIQSIAKG